MNKLLCATVLAVSTAQADTIYVDANCPGGDGSELDPYCSIQTAIDNAVDTDEIVVAPGTYFETIDFIGKAIAVRSLDGAEVTIIDAGGFGGLGTVVTCESGEGADTVLDGFTLTGGMGTDPGTGFTRGGGMYNVFSSPTVTNCTFRGNTAGQGGGMGNYSSNPTVTNCSFSGNTAENGGGFTRGGGMYNGHASGATSGSSPTVTNCTFSGNTSFRGGGMMDFSYFTTNGPTVTDCTFSGNIAYDRGGGMSILIATATVTNCTFSGNTASRGGGMSIVGGSPTVANCTFSGNTAGTGGGMFNDASTLTVTNCTFSGNTADFGGGLYNSGFGSSPTVTNCTFRGNSAGTGGGMFNDASTLTVTNCILWDDSPDEIMDFFGAVTTVLYSDVQFGSLGIGNIDANPLFVGGPLGTWTGPGVFNPAAGVTTFTDTNASFAPGGLVGGFLVPWTDFPTERPIVANTATTISVVADVAFLGVPGFAYEVNDYRLTATSPCIDAGDNTAVPDDIDTDLDGNPRFLEVPETPDTGNGTLPIVDMGAYESLGGGCLAVTSQEVVCHADGTTFTVNVAGLNACTGGATQVTFTGSGGAVGEELCFTALVDDGGFCCSTELRDRPRLLTGLRSERRWRCRNPRLPRHAGRMGLLLRLRRLPGRLRRRLQRRYH